MKPDLWKTFNLGIATTLGVLGIGYVLTSPLDRDPVADSAAPLAPAFRVVASSYADAPVHASDATVSTTIATATSVDVAPVAPPVGALTTSPPLSSTPTITAVAPAPAPEPPVTFVPLASTTTTVSPTAAPNTTGPSSTTTTGAPVVTTTTSSAPTGSGDAPQCLLRLWDPVAQQWFCLL